MAKASKKKPAGGVLTGWHVSALQKFCQKNGIEIPDEDSFDLLDFLRAVSQKYLAILPTAFKIERNIGQLIEKEGKDSDQFGGSPACGAMVTTDMEECPYTGEALGSGEGDEETEDAADAEEDGDADEAEEDESDEEDTEEESDEEESDEEEDADEEDEKPAKKKVAKPEPKAAKGKSKKVVDEDEDDEDLEDSEEETDEEDEDEKPAAKKAAKGKPSKKVVEEEDEDEADEELDEADDEEEDEKPAPKKKGKLKAVEEDADEEDEEETDEADDEEDEEDAAPKGKKRGPKPKPGSTAKKDAREAKRTELQGKLMSFKKNPAKLDALGYRELLMVNSLLGNSRPMAIGDKDEQVKAATKALLKFKGTVAEVADEDEEDEKPVKKKALKAAAEIAKPKKKLRR